MLLFTLESWAHALNNCFPGGTHVLTSPSKKFAVIWSESANTRESHRLLYRINQASKPVELLQFDREVCVHWSPQEDYVAITDYTASNIAETFIYRTGDVSHPMNVIDVLPCRIQDFFGKGLSHGYIEALSWTNKGLSVRVFGDRNSNPRTFDVMLRCYIKRDRWVCESK